MPLLSSGKAEEPAEVEEPEIVSPIIEASTVKEPLNVDEVMNRLVRKTENVNAGCYDDTIQVTYEEAQILMKLAQAEAGNQGVNGMYLVMQVVWNRVQSEDFPDSIYEVVHQTGQFQTVTNGSIDKVEISNEAHLALAELEKANDIDPTIIGFETVGNGNTLEMYFDLAYTEGGHNFYKCKEEKNNGR